MFAFYFSMVKKEKKNKSYNFRKVLLFFSGKESSFTVHIKTVNKFMTSNLTISLLGM